MSLDYKAKSSEKRGDDTSVRKQNRKYRNQIGRTFSYLE